MENQTYKDLDLKYTAGYLITGAYYCGEEVSVFNQSLDTAEKALNFYEDYFNHFAKLKKSMDECSHPSPYAFKISISKIHSYHYNNTVYVASITLDELKERIQK